MKKEKEDHLFWLIVIITAFLTCSVYFYNKDPYSNSTIIEKRQ